MMSGYPEPSKTGEIRTLDSVNSKSFTKIYCSCGRIVGLDRNEVLIKKNLKKELECTSCRNLRISREIEALDNHFNGVDEEDLFYSL